MAYFSTTTAPERGNPTGKNRVWVFFRLSNETHPANRRRPAQPRRKIRRQGEPTVVNDSLVRNALVRLDDIAKTLRAAQEGGKKHPTNEKPSQTRK